MIARSQSGRGALLVVVLVLAASLVGFAVLAGYPLLRGARLGLRLSKQPAILRLVEPLSVTARVQAPMKITLDGTIAAKVPLRQTLALPVRGRYQTTFDLDTMVPLRFEVAYEGTIPVDSSAAIRARTDFNYNDAKYIRNLGFAATLPLKLDIPVKLRVPVDQAVRIRYHGPLTVEIDQTVHAPVDIEIPADIRVAKDFETMVTSEVRLRVAPPRQPLRIVIDEAGLGLRLSTLRLETKGVGPDRERVAPAQ